MESTEGSRNQGWAGVDPPPPQAPCPYPGPPLRGRDLRPGWREACGERYSPVAERFPGRAQPRACRPAQGKRRQVLRLEVQTTLCGEEKTRTKPFQSPMIWRASDPRLRARDERCQDSVTGTASPNAANRKQESAPLPTWGERRPALPPPVGGLDISKRTRGHQGRVPVG